MTSTRKRCNAFATAGNGADDLEKYRAALVYSTLFARFYNTLDRDFEFTAAQLMDFDIYTALSRVQQRLRQRGIVSENASALGNANDVLDAVHLPTFLFLDTFIADDRF